MKKALVIGLKDLRLRLRDRTAIVIAFIAPLVLATIITFAFGSEEVTFRATFAIADLDRSDVSKSFLEGIRQVPALENALELKPVESEEEARSLVEKEQVGAGLVLPAGFGDAIRAGLPAEIKVLRHVERGIAGALAEAIAEGFASEVSASQLSIQTAVAAGVFQKPGAPSLQELIERAVAGRIPVGLVDGPIGAREVKTSSYFGPSMSVFFLLFTVQFGALGILAERRDGTLARLLASPTRAWAVVAGKLLSSFVLGLLSIGTMIFATTLLLDANWGDPLAVGALVIAMVLAAMGVTGIVIVAARSLEQAQGYGQMAAVGLALLGGNFIPINEAPALIRSLALATPNGWAVRAFFDLSAEGGGIETVVTALVAILAFAVVTGLIALLMGRRLVVA